MFDADRARARVMIGTVLPLLEDIVRGKPAISERLTRTHGTIQIEARGSEAAARLVISSGRVRIIAGRTLDADVRCVFDTDAALAAFFAGKAALPRIEGATRTRLLLAAARLLLELRVLEPPDPRTRDAMSAADRSLRVALVLRLVTRALSQLHRESWPPIVELARESPERIYQWTVGPNATTAAWLRMERGRVHAGSGVYEARAPFVHFAFPDADAAFAVLMATESSMSGFRGGKIATHGSPEYARKLALMMQDVDAFLAPGR